ncbi:MAG: EAL domain-containing protein [Burkholderiaceae bacterium]|nr:EAL domain-containing protein [Burkholderiaceae bacterium]
MNRHFLGAKEVVTGDEIFRVSSLLLYVTLLLDVAVAGYTRHLNLTGAIVGMLVLLVFLFALSLLRYLASHWIRHNSGGALAELMAAVAIIVVLTVQHAMPTPPLPWLIALAGVFPLAIEGGVALRSVLLIGWIGLGLNLDLGAQLSDWLPNAVATVFVGLLAVLLAHALDNNIAAVWHARTNDRRFDAIARATRHVFLIADAGYRLKFSNPALYEVIGYTQQDLAAEGATLHIHPDDKVEHQKKLRYLRDTPRSRIFSRHRVQHKDGQWIWMETNGYNMLHDPAIEGLVFSLEDITARKDVELKLEQEHARLEHQALHDPLTGLPNRRYVLSKIGAAIGIAPAANGKMTMLFCDLDFFKSVNDTHGHDFGDQCLMQLTQRIVAELPPQDFVARFGGNEFIILTESGIAEALQKAEALLLAVSRQLVVDNTFVKIQTSIGVAELKAHHKNPSELIRDADAATYQAKERGRNRVEVFNASLQDTSTKRAQMDVALRFALERNELALVYQPKVCMLDGAVQGFELLLRWNSPEYGVISPNEFIPIAETSGMVVPIGLWVLEEACKQLALWQAKYPQAAHLTVAVNVSMRQLLQTSFLPDVTRIVKQTGVLPHALELEITETSAMANPLQTIENLSMLKKLGLRLALDDFGTGYSSLSYLQKLPIDVLKIDKSFVRGLGQHQGDAEIVRLILALAHTLNLETIAEGVESREHIAELTKLGCYIGQGYIFSPPVTAAAAELLIRTTSHFLPNGQEPQSPNAVTVVV